MKLSIILMSLIFLSSCSNNRVALDLKSGNINSCSNIPIKKILVEGKDNNDFYLFTVHEDSINIKKFNIYNGNDAFVVTDNTGSQIHDSLYSLKPNSLYEISNVSYGDAAKYTLEVNTDEKGMANSAVPSTCSN